jgi:hypothetical protein
MCKLNPCNRIIIARWDFRRCIKRMLAQLFRFRTEIFINFFQPPLHNNTVRENIRIYNRFTVDAKQRNVTLRPLFSG